MTVEADLRKKVEMLSQPTALFKLRECMSLWISVMIDLILRQ